MNYWVKIISTLDAFLNSSNKTKRSTKIHVNLLQHTYLHIDLIPLSLNTLKTTADANPQLESDLCAHPL